MAGGQRDHVTLLNPGYVELRTDPGMSWKVMEFKIQIFQALKVAENKPNGCRISDPYTRFQPSLHTLSLSTVRLGSICCLV